MKTTIKQKVSLGALLVISIAGILLILAIDAATPLIYTCDYVVGRCRLEQVYGVERK